MGQFRIKIEAVGGHGCNRDQRGHNGGGCGLSTCPDCAARRLVVDLKAMGCSVSLAEVQHWYDDKTFPNGQIIDDLLTNGRAGNF